MVPNRAKCHIFNKRDELRHCSANNDIDITLWSENIALGPYNFYIKWWVPSTTTHNLSLWTKRKLWKANYFAKKTVLIENTVLFTSQLFWQNIIVPKTNNIRTSLSRIGSTQTPVWVRETLTFLILTVS